MNLHPSASPRELVLEWVRRFNLADADGLAELYAPDAINHQVTWEPLAGQDAIRDMFRREFGLAPMVCQVEHIFEDGEWAILEWTDPLGLRGCGFFRVLNGKIAFQRGYWDRLTFLRIHGLPLPSE